MTEATSSAPVPKQELCANCRKNPVYKTAWVGTRVVGLCRKCANRGVKTIRKQELRPGRNDPCPCGSGLKFKKCCIREQ
jgi:hypothetical protein